MLIRFLTPVNSNLQEKCKRVRIYGRLSYRELMGVNGRSSYRGFKISRLNCIHRYDRYSYRFYIIVFIVTDTRPFKVEFLSPWDLLWTAVNQLFFKRSQLIRWLGRLSPGSLNRDWIKSSWELNSVWLTTKAKKQKLRTRVLFSKDTRQRKLWPLRWIKVEQIMFFRWATCIDQACSLSTETKVVISFMK